MGNSVEINRPKALLGVRVFSILQTFMSLFEIVFEYVHTRTHVNVYFVDEMRILNKATFSWNDFS